MRCLAKFAVALGFATLSAPPFAFAEDHLAEAISHIREAIDQARQGDADALNKFVTQAEAALKHAQAAVVKKDNAETKRGIIRLNAAIYQGKQKRSNFATKYVREALTHLEAAQNAAPEFPRLAIQAAPARELSALAPSAKTASTRAPAPPGWPDASNTGVPAGTTLTPSGDITITTESAVISGLDIKGTVSINADNVTLQNSKVTASGWFVVKIASGVKGAVIQNCEINGTGANNDGQHGILGQGTFLRNNIYNVENGITLQESNTTIRDNYIHGLKASGSPHYDGIQIDGGVSNVTISHNTVINDYNQTSAVMIDNYFGPISNIIVNNNRLVGGGYTVYDSAQFNSNPIAGVSITNNRLGKGQWGYTDFNGTSPPFTGNADDVTGKPVN